MSATQRTARPGPARGLDVDWALAGRWAGRLASPGPTASRDELARLVEDLHDAARRALPMALTAARLGPAVEAAGTTATAQVLVVDRPGWSRAAARSFAGMTEAAGLAASSDARWARLAGVRAAPTTAQAAAVLALLAGRVLGQFDPFAPDAPPGGRLLLVAPNVLRTERLISATPADFRLWVCVHEQTHALQFAAAPWLAGHLRAEVAALVAELSETSALQEVGTAVEGALRTLRGRGEAESEAELGVLEILLQPEQRDRVERITAVMSLLEGHADVSMDAVGRRSIPSVRRLRARFDARRRHATGLDRVLRRVLGMDAKLAQYRRGAAFVRAVRRTGGRDALDAVWSGPQALPTPREISDPRAWVRRVHG
jgi:coenzyme F420 biosynthesis associated uncharacterized protein